MKIVKNCGFPYVLPSRFTVTNYSHVLPLRFTVTNYSHVLPLRFTVTYYPHAFRLSSPYLYLCNGIHRTCIFLEESNDRKGNHY